MLTRAALSRSLGLPRSPGACFGVSDPRYLRPAFNQDPLPPPEGLAARIRVSIYRLEWAEPNFDLLCFRVKNKGLAFIRMMRILRIKGKLNLRKFQKAGGEALFCGNCQIFPKPKHKK